MDAVALARCKPRRRKRGSVRRSRVVLAPRPWRYLRKVSFRTTGARKAASPGRARISRKPLRGESRVVSAVPVVPPPCFLLHGDYGRSRRPAFPAPSVKERDNEIAQLGRKQAAGMLLAVWKLNQQTHCRPGQASAASGDPGPITTGSSFAKAEAPAFSTNNSLWLWILRGAIAPHSSPLSRRPGMTEGAL